MRPPASTFMERVLSFHNGLLILTFSIVAFVLALMLYASWRFHERRHPKPSRVTHNTRLEVLWTVVPAVILLIMVVQSIDLIRFQEKIPEDIDLTVKIVGHQWYWSYSYPDHDLEYDSFMLSDEERRPEQPRLLATDTPLVLPLGQKIRFIITASDVLHAYALPALGMKMDAVPGRLNELWIEPTKVGTFYGQCSELCGQNHAYMPSEVHVVPEAEFTAWLAASRAAGEAQPLAQPLAAAAVGPRPGDDRGDDRHGDRRGDRPASES